ncbi:hypothetical protein ACQ9BO_13495 [Flavobacterium sp. P21]|uniref:hypothetical protein n=1 Tax=Flavobacterium sp. P21 TaxID=3423948 RepID=UPI003D66B07A
MSIFNRAKLSSTIFDSIISNPEYIPANTQKRNLYVNSTDLSQIKIKFNKYSRKLYYEYRDASDALVINTYSLPS